MFPYLAATLLVAQLTLEPRPDHTYSLQLHVGVVPPGRGVALSNDLRVSKAQEPTAPRLDSPSSCGAGPYLRRHRTPFHTACT
eukprot:2992330-Pleurochrysis_carterae.AAC.4